MIAISKNERKLLRKEMGTAEIEPPVRDSRNSEQGRSKEEVKIETNRSKQFGGDTDYATRRV